MITEVTCSGCMRRLIHMQSPSDLDMYIHRIDEDLRRVSVMYYMACISLGLETQT